jgi:type IV pilus assembly protein PilE
MNHIASIRQDQRPGSGDQWGSLAAPVEPIMEAPRALRGTSRPGTCGERRSARGFTLVELMLVVAVASILSGVAYPSFMGQLQKIRRADALVAVMQLQAAQERWRANNTSYGTLAQIAVGSASSAGHYVLQVTAQSDDGYELLATAQGVQANDVPCRLLRLRAEGGNLTQSSGPDADTNNAPSANRQCWSL